MPGKGLEPILLTEPDPKSGASTNFATQAENVGQWECLRSRQTTDEPTQRNLAVFAAHDAQGRALRCPNDCGPRFGGTERNPAEPDPEAGSAG